MPEEAPGWQPRTHLNPVPNRQNTLQKERIPDLDHNPEYASGHSLLGDYYPGNDYQRPGGPTNRRTREGDDPMSTATTTTLAELPSFKGQMLGVSDWFEITQERVNTFADATDDHQWIHVDVERAKAESPYRGPIAHGFLTLSLFVPMWSQILVVTDATMGVNYGLNRVRFPSPVPVGSLIRLEATLVDVEEIKGGVQLVADGVIGRRGGDKPVCALQSVTRLYA
jgi:acyl dehydratase